MLFIFYIESVYHQELHSFPTRRSSDLSSPQSFIIRMGNKNGHFWSRIFLKFFHYLCHPGNYNLSYPSSGDRKSTRLNSSHVAISYAVFCLKKKKDIVSTYILDIGTIIH